ncbi:MAG: DUF4932 domain-containing protein [Bacteroidota bacterium]
MQKKITLLLTVTVLSIINLMAQKTVSKNNKVNVKVHEPTELLFTIYHLTPDAERFFKATKKQRDWVDDLSAPLIAPYQPYKSHAAVEAFKNLAKAYNEWLPLLVNIGIQNETMPLDTQCFQPDQETDYAQAVRQFIKLANDFYADTQFGERFAANRAVSKGLEAEVAANLPNPAFFTTMESFYKKTFLSYNLYPSPLLPAGNGMGFGPHHKTPKGTKVFNVFCGIDRPNVHPQNILKEGVQFGFQNAEWVRNICTHEFGHSFVNEPLFVHRSEFNKYVHLQKPIKKAMKGQGYWYWDSILAEHLVRVGEILIAQKLGLTEVSESLYYDYYINRKFIYLPHFLEVMKPYESGVFTGTYIDFLPTIVESLAEIDALKALKDWKKAKKKGAIR